MTQSTKKIMKTSEVTIRVYPTLEDWDPIDLLKLKRLAKANKVPESKYLLGLISKEFKNSALSFDLDE